MVKRAFLLASVAMVATASASRADMPEKLEAFLSYTFVGELTAPESGDRIA